MHSAGALSPEDAAEVLAGFDIDGDGALDLEEFVAALAHADLAGGLALYSSRLPFIVVGCLI